MSTIRIALTKRSWSHQDLGAIIVAALVFFSPSLRAGGDSLSHLTSDPRGNGIEVDGKAFDLKPIEHHAIFVTHPYGGFIQNEKLTKDTNALIAAFAERHRPILYLAFPGAPQDKELGGPYVDNLSPTAAIVSDGGQHNVPYLAASVTVAGGALDACEQRTIDSLIYEHFQGREEPFTIHVPLPTSYAIVKGDPRSPGTLSPVSEIREELQKNPQSVPAIDRLFPAEKNALDPFLRWMKAIYSPDPKVRRAFEEDAFGAKYAAAISRECDFGFPRSQLKVEVYLDDHLAFVEGAGPKVVRLKLWSTLSIYATKVLSHLSTLPIESEPSFLSPAATPHSLGAPPPPLTH